MFRTLAGLVALVVLMPLAAAGPVDATPSPEAPSVLTTLADRAGDAASGAADAASAAAGAAGSALRAVGSAIASAASAVGHAIAAFAGAIGAGLVAIASSFALFGSAAFGFMSKHPKETAIVAGSSAGGAGLWWALKRFGGLLFLPLYTRLAPSQMLDNEARASVYEHVRAHPGAHPSGLAEALGLGWGTVVYHLHRLEESKLVVSKLAHHRKCYFAVGTELGSEARTAVAAMAHEKARRIVETVHASPGISQKDLAARVGMSQALASWHVKRLVESGVLLTTREGRTNALRVAAHVPVETSVAATPAAVA